MSGNPYRPLFVENDMKVTYQMTLEEVEDALLDWLEARGEDVPPTPVTMSFVRGVGAEVIGISIEVEK